MIITAIMQITAIFRIRRLVTEDDVPTSTAEETIGITECRFFPLRASRDPAIRASTRARRMKM
jgi:hypothetical protein